MNPKRVRDDADRAGALAAVGAALVVVGGLAAVFTKGTPRLAAAGLVLIGLAALGLRVLQWLQLAAAIRIERRREDQTARISLRGPPVAIAALSVEAAGADRLQTPVDYIVRTSEHEITRRLEEAKRAAVAGHGKRMVIVAGPSKAGKSRLLIEAARKVLPDWIVIRPTPAGLSGCLHAEAIPEGTNLERIVLWLDDLEPFARLGPDGLNAATLDAYLDEFAETQNCRVLILATRGGKGQEQASDQDDPGRGMSALAELEPLSHIVELNERLDASETANAAAVLAPLSLWDRPQVERYGLGAYLVGGPALLASLRTGRGADGRTNRAGQHLAWLVAWWAHIGIVEPVSREQLEAMWQACPDPEAGTVGGVIDDALQWARTPLVASRPAVALVCGSDDDGYAIYDYIRARVAEAGSPPFDAALLTGIILRLVKTEQLFRIGWSAYDRGDDVLAERAWITQLQRGEEDPVLGPLVSYGLGLLLKRKGETDGAIKMFELVLQSQHPDAAPRAEKSIATMLWERDGPDAAEPRFRALMAGHHPEVAPSAAYDLGLLLERKHEFDGAESAYRAAINSRHPRTAPRAAVNLGRMLWNETDTEQEREVAIGWFELATTYGDPEQSAKAYMNIGHARLVQGDRPAVEAALLSALREHHPDISPNAALRLGEYRWRQGDRDGAADAFRAATAYVDTDDGWRARVYLGALHQEVGEIPEARDEYQAVLGCDRPGPTASAARHLAAALETSGDRAAAIALYERAIDCEAGTDSDHAACRLALLLDEDHDYDGARAGFEQARASEDNDLSAYAAYRLGSLAESQGDLNMAANAYAQASTAPDPSTAAFAAARLGDVLNRTGDAEGAIRAFRRAAESGINEIVPAASLLLGSVLAGEGETPAARQALEDAMKSGNRKLRKQAKRMLNELPDAWPEE